MYYFKLCGHHAASRKQRVFAGRHVGESRGTALKRARRCAAHTPPGVYGGGGSLLVAPRIHLRYRTEVVQFDWLQSRTFTHCPFTELKAQVETGTETRSGNAAGAIASKEDSVDANIMVLEDVRCVIGECWIRTHGLCLLMREYQKVIRAP
jgi:hypothetical protein